MADRGPAPSRAAPAARSLTGGTRGKRPRSIVIGEHEAGPYCTVAEESPKVIALRGANGSDLRFTRRGAATLGRFLLDWSQPERRVRLWGIAEIAYHFSVTRQAVAHWRTNVDDFPKPVAELSCGPVWEAWQVKAWHKLWKRAPGRPRSTPT